MQAQELLDINSRDRPKQLAAKRDDLNAVTHDFRLAEAPASALAEVHGGSGRDVAPDLLGGSRPRAYHPGG